MESSNILKIIYTFFLGLILAIFVGVGINTFYETPTMPTYSADTNSYGKEPTDQQVVQQRAYDKQIQQYEKDLKPYNRNVSIIALAVSVLYVIISLLFEKRIKFIADGVMLGGVFTLLYSMIRSFATEDSKYVFVVVSVGLVIALYLGYHKFVKAVPNKGSAKNRVR